MIGTSIAWRMPAVRTATRRRDEEVATADAPVVAIVGRPNVGKTTFFARATGKYAETANLPGTTVSVSRREIRDGGRSAFLVDLPGTFTIGDQSDGLPAFWRLLLEARPDAILAVVDAGDLARHLPLALACRDLGLPLVVAANLSDEAASRGIRLDLGRLSQLLAAPVFRTVGRTGEGVRDAVDAAVAAARERRSRGATRHVAPAPPYAFESVLRAQQIARQLADRTAVDAPSDLRDAVTANVVTPIGAATIALADILEPQRWAVAARWAQLVERRRDIAPRLSDRIAWWASSPIPGLPAFLAISLGALGITMVVGTILATALANAWAAFVSVPLTTLVEGVVPVPSLAQATLWALDSGLLAMVSVGLPFVLSFYLVLAVIEDSGYLAVSAVLTDRLFNAAGLQGRVAIPILAATGCNVPAIYGTRVLDSRRERLLASFLIVLTPCSARSAVVIAALAPFAGPLAAVAAFGVVVLVAVIAGVAANAIVPGRQSPLVLELPPLRRPIARQVWRKAWFRFRSFVRTAAPVMLLGSFLLGLAYETGALTPLEAALSPVTVGVLGLPPVAGVALVLGFVRKELALQLLVVLAVARFGAGASNLSTFMSSGQLFVYAVITAVSVPCAATLASLADELGWRSTAAICASVLGLALVVGGVLSRILG